MRSVRSIVATSLVLLAVSSTAGAQAPPGPAEGPPLTVQAAVAEALERNPALASLRRASDAAAARPATERALVPPMIEAQIWEWPINTFNPWNVTMYMFGVSQDLPGKGKRDLRASLMAAEARMTAADVAVKAREIASDVERAYAELSVARRAIAIYQENVALMRQFADISQAKYAAGRISQQDVVKPVVEISRMYEEIIGLKERARLAEAELNALLDRPPDAPIGALVEPQETVPLPPVAVLQARALESQPELQAARLAIERADAAVAVARSEYAPDYRVSGSYMLEPQMRDAWMASFSFTWPKAPWARKGVDAKAVAAAADVEAARARVRALESRVRLAVQQAYVRAESAAERASLLETSLLPQAALVVDLARVAYQADRADFLDLIDNQRVQLNLQLEYWRALAERDQARADLARAVGSELEGPADAQSR
jgi:cobalt-zinc-cadmium efflux system outer membrane protein